METKPIDRNSKDIAIVKKLYETAFPEEERLAFEALSGLRDKADVEFMAYYEEGLAGFTYTYTIGRFCWFFYFAVEKERRGQGIGTRIIRSLLQRHSDKLVVIDIEDLTQEAGKGGTLPEGLADEAMRHRRHDFYQRMGFRESGIHRTFYGITYNIMVCGEGSISDSEYQQLIDTMWKQIENL